MSQAFVQDIGNFVAIKIGVRCPFSHHTSANRFFPTVFPMCMSAALPSCCQGIVSLQWRHQLDSVCSPGQTCESIHSSQRRGSRMHQTARLGLPRWCGQQFKKPRSNVFFVALHSSLWNAWQANAFRVSFWWAYSGCCTPQHTAG